MVILLGLLIGFLAAIPIGPIHVFAVSQTLKHDFLHGLLVGLTTSLMDIIYCFIAIEGISRSTLILTELDPILKFIGAVLLSAISIRLIKQSKTFDQTKFPQKLPKTYSSSIIVTFFLYASNPTLYAFWLAVGGTVTAHQWVVHVGWRPALFALSCGFGSVIWYLILAKYASKYHQQFKPKTFRKIFIGLAIILIGFAIYSLATLFY